MIDGHAHVWDAQLFPMEWLRRYPRLGRRYTMRDLRSSAGEAMPDRVVLVQAGTDPDGTSWLLRSVEDDPAVGAVVASCRLGDDESWADLQRRVRAAQAADAGGRLRGFRISGLGRGDDFFARPVVREGLAVLAERGLSAHLLVDPGQLLGVASALSRAAGVYVVLDHLGSPPQTGPRTTWRSGIAALAQSPAVVAKLSGAIVRTERGLDDAESAVAWVLACFGVDRLMFGSDWPASATALPYARVLDRTRAILARIGADPEAEQLWTGVAARVLRIAAPAAMPSPTDTAAVDREDNGQ